MRLEIGTVFGVVEVGQDPAVDLGMQRDDSVSEHDRVAGHVGHVDDRDGLGRDGLGGPSARDDFPAQVVQAPGQFGDAVLVVYGQQRARRTHRTDPLSTI